MAALQYVPTVLKLSILAKNPQNCLYLLYTNDAVHFTYHEPDMNFSGSNSLQFTSNTELFYISDMDLFVHQMVFEEVACENSIIVGYENS